MSASETTFGIPLPPPQPTAEKGRAGQLVGDFLSATGTLSCGATAELAGVRMETIRKWRRRLPRWVKLATSRRIAAWLAGEPPPDRDVGFQRLFLRVLRSVPGDEHGTPGPVVGRIRP